MVKKRWALVIFIVIALLSFTSPLSFAVDPYDPFDLSDKGGFWPEAEEQNDDLKTSEELIADATMLLTDERPLDARTKLLKALEKDPGNPEIYTLLAHYYNFHVGHFRLALKYVKQARRLFEKANGPAPYTDQMLMYNHARILHLLSDIRLNLDDYSGALKSLDEYASYYFGEWYPGSRAWVLMKLGKLQEAIRVAKLGILSGAEPGRTYNILAILLSLSGKRDESLEVFNKAILYEMSLGSSGQPATPLNNSGEVYREIFEEDRAEASWRKAVSLPDGCEHVLPSLNLSILYMEQLRYKEAKQSMDRFEACVRQYPLRNGEEHRALVHVARGRVDLHTGNLGSAIEHIEAARERKQWFGKIGTNVEDMQAATLISLGQALKRENNILNFRRNLSWNDWLEVKEKQAFNRVRAWWLFRRARQVLAEDLNDFEDLYPRHTDSLLEYDSLGEVLSGFWPSELRKRIEQIKKEDKRPFAAVYYDAYLAENYLANFKHKSGMDLLKKSLARARPKADTGLIMRSKHLELKRLDPTEIKHLKTAEEIY
ncbi:MAG: hypothetical protein KDD53_08405, partial [Bdellovibrionales bacterium]|nr:hypothetical protein [Bdellovibrionales bacterium]